MSHIFISYAHTDKQYMERLSTSLKRRGFTVWSDKNIDHGDRWVKEIATAINQCAALIVIMSPEAEESEWVEKEILITQRMNKPIYPLLLRGSSFLLLITMQFEDVQNEELPSKRFYNELATASGLESKAKTTKPISEPKVQDSTSKSNSDLLIVDDYRVSNRKKIDILVRTIVKSRSPWKLSAGKLELSFGLTDGVLHVVSNALDAKNLDELKVKLEKGEWSISRKTNYLAALTGIAAAVGLTVFIPGFGALLAAPLAVMSVGTPFIHRKWVISSVHLESIVSDIEYALDVFGVHNLIETILAESS